MSASPMDCRVGRIEVVRDPVADALDDMAALAQHWAKNRERGRNPSSIRAAMLMVAREALAHVDQQERELQQRTDELCGPADLKREVSNQPTVVQKSNLAALVEIADRQAKYGLAPHNPQTTGPQGPVSR